MVFDKPWSIFCWKKSLAFFIGAALVILTLLDAVLFHVFVPAIPQHFIKITPFVSYINDPESNNNLINNDSLPGQAMKKLEYEPVEAHMFTSLYINILKIYNASSTIDAANASRKRKVISCFNCPDWFNEHTINMYNRDFKPCPYSECTFDLGSMISTADVVLFFVGELGKRAMPQRPAGQIWVKCGWESPAHYSYPTPYEPWRSVFNWTFTYRRDSDIFAPNNRLAWRNSADLLPDSAYCECMH